MTDSANHYISWIDIDKELHSVALQSKNATIRIGRSHQTDIVIFNKSVSRVHLELTWEQEELQIKDVGSTYGTWIENVRLNKGEIKSVTADTELRLGNLSMWYEIRQKNEPQELMQSCSHSTQVNEYIELTKEINNFRVELKSLLKDNFDDNTHNMQLCFHSTKVNEDIKLTEEINNFRVKLKSLLKDNFGDNTQNIQLIDSINEELLQLISNQERRFKEQRILNSISHILNRSLTLSELLKTSLNLVSKVLNAERGFVVLNNSPNNEYKILATRYFDKLSWSSEDNTAKEFSQSLVESCFNQNKIFIIDDTLLVNTQDLLGVKSGGGRSIVVIPLVQDGKVVGVIYLDNQQLPNNFDLQQIPFLTTYAAHTSIALHNTLLYKRAITDDLTQLYTRQHIDEGLAIEIKRAQRDNSDLSILILDLDHFKKVNDIYGHTTGDQVLQRFSKIIKEHTNDCDMAGRFGGEEFVVVLADRNINDAKLFAERIRLSIEKEQIKKDDKIIQITVSIGVANYQKQHGDKALLLFEDADQALYQAKEQGRNQTVCFTSKAN